MQKLYSFTGRAIREQYRFGSIPNVRGNAAGVSPATERLNASNESDKKTELSKTGDDSNPAFWTILLFLSMTAMAELGAVKEQKIIHATCSLHLENEKWWVSNGKNDIISIYEALKISKWRTHHDVR